MPLNIRKHTKAATIADTGFNMVIFGNPGSGKTTLASSFPDVLYVDTQQGTRFVDNTMDVVNIQTWQDVKDIIALMDSPDSPYKTVVWDVLDQVYILYLEFLQKQKPALFTSNGAPQIQAWQVIKSAWLKFMKMSCQNEKFNSVFILHEKAVKGDDGKTIEIRPTLSPSLLPITIGEVDFVGFKENVYSTDFRDLPHLPDVKDRLKVLKNLDGAVQNATYEVLRDITLGKITPLAAVLPAVFTSVEHAFQWAQKLGMTEDQFKETLASINAPKKAIALREILYKLALKTK